MKTSNTYQYQKKDDVYLFKQDNNTSLSLQKRLLTNNRDKNYVKITLRNGDSHYLKGKVSTELVIFPATGLMFIKQLIPNSDYHKRIILQYGTEQP